MPSPHIPHGVHASTPEQVAVEQVWLYRQRARTTPLYYVLVAVGLLLMFTAFMGQSSQDSPWIGRVVGGLGALFGLGALYALLRDWQVGSFVDPLRKTLQWWASYPPVQVQVIPLAELGRIRLSESSDGSTLTLFDRKGRRVSFPAECAPRPWVAWAAALQELDPAIDVQRD